MPKMIAPLLGLLSAPVSFAAAQTAGSFAESGSTLVSAMMMFLGNEQNVYILDKAQENAAQVNGHPAWGSVWNIQNETAGVMEVYSNTFCASGMHLPNGSYVTFGGNGAIGYKGVEGNELNPGGYSAEYDTQLQDYDGTKAIRILNPCTDDDDWASSKCQWFDNPQVLSMQEHRWYAGTEALADGSVVVIGGFTNGGYVNRNYPNVDPTWEGNASQPTYEFYPSRGDAQLLQFMTTTSGLNAYAHSYLMPSGKMFLQAYWSTILWDYDNNVETALPDMPNNVARVYPASGAVAMLPLTPANNYTPTIIFCGGSNMTDEMYGNYSWPFIDTWNYPASNDCHTITPEPADGSSPEYVQTDDMPVGRTMGQFIALPDGTYLVVNGGANGTAGYSNAGTLTSTAEQMPWGESLAAAPVLTPVLYDPSKPSGSRWSSADFQASKYPRLYHSSAILLPDASVLIAGSSPNIYVNLTAPFPTTYQAERFFPPYFNASVRPTFSGAPSTLSYGGSYFDLLVPSSAYPSGTAADDAAGNTTVVLMRPGFTTHAMNMGQRHLQLNNTYTVNSNGSYTLHVSQVPPNANLLTPGPALIFVVVNGVPSNGTMVIVGNGQVGTQPTQAAAALPDSVNLASASGGSGASSSNSSSSSSSGSKSGAVGQHAVAGGALLGGAVAGIALVVGNLLL